MLSLVLLLIESSFSPLLTLWKGWWELGGHICNEQDEQLIKEEEKKMLQKQPFSIQGNEDREKQPDLKFTRRKTKACLRLRFLKKC